MKIALVYGPGHLSGKVLNFDDPYSQPLTGSELSFVRHFQNLGRLHEVHAFTPGPKVGNRMGYDFPTTLSGYDAAVSWHDVEPLKSFSLGTLRLVSYHFNSFEYHAKDADRYVDKWLSPSDVHMDMVPFMYAADGLPPPDMSKWSVVPNGCLPVVYDELLKAGASKTPGRVLWASSPDRGLHHLLSIWPDIKRVVPHASLHITYGITRWLQRALGPGWNEEEHARAVYIHERLQWIQSQPDRMGVRVFDAVAYERMCQEMVEAEVLAYPCDPFRWTESYCISLMEACAARACPITAAADAIPSIYGSAIPMVPNRARDHLPEFTALVVRALTDKPFRDEVNRRARALAETQTWQRSTEILLGIISSALGLRRHGVTGFIYR